jgi:hypothetical protein
MVNRHHMKFMPRYAAAALLAAFVGMVGHISAAYADELALDGTLDCGASSEDYCPIRDKIVLISSGLSGVKERVTIHIDWIKDEWNESPPLQATTTCCR